MVTMLCLFEQDFLKYYTKAGMDTEELEVGVFTLKGTVQTKKRQFRWRLGGHVLIKVTSSQREVIQPPVINFFFKILVLQLTGTCHSHDS